MGNMTLEGFIVIVYFLSMRDYPLRGLNGLMYRLTRRTGLRRGAIRLTIAMSRLNRAAMICIMIYTLGNRRRLPAWMIDRPATVARRLPLAEDQRLTKSPHRRIGLQ